MRALYCIFEWIGRLTGTIVMTPHPSAVGNCAEQIYFGLLQARRERKKLVVLFPYELPWPLKFRLADINIELGKIESEYRVPLRGALLIAGRVLVTVFYAFFRFLSLALRKTLGRPLSDFYTVPMIGTTTLWQTKERMPDFSWEEVKKYDWKGQLEVPLGVSLGKRQKAIGRCLRTQMGLPDSSWFACLHVRDGGYHNDHHATERNANIENYLEAIREITNRGGWVVRMGDTTMPRLPTLDRVIDYPFTEAKSALMDLYLISECRVYIGMQTGIFDVAILFERPMILTNMANWLYPFPLKKGDIGLLKQVFSKSRKRILTIGEWLAEPFDATSFFCVTEDYQFFENDAQELKAAVTEFLDRDAEWEPTPLQHQFNQLRIRSATDLLGAPITADFQSKQYFLPDDTSYDLFQRYRIASRLHSAEGMLGADFLKKKLETNAGLASSFFGVTTH